MPTPPQPRKPLGYPTVASILVQRDAMVAAAALPPVPRPRDPVDAADPLDGAVGA